MITTDPSDIQDQYQPLFTSEPDSPVFDEPLKDILCSSFNEGISYLAPEFNFTNISSLITTDPGNIPSSPGQLTTPPPPPPPLSDLPHSQFPAAIVEIFEDNGKPLKLEKRKLSQQQLAYRDSLDIGKLKGERCTTFKEDPKAQSKCRNNHITGICKKMKELKIATGDDTLISFIKNRGTSKEKIRKFSSAKELFDNENIQPLSLPSQLDITSQNKKKLKLDHCITCGRGKDKKVWVGCGHRKCVIWQHLTCMGLYVKNVNSIKWVCPKHRENFS